MQRHKRRFSFFVTLVFVITDRFSRLWRSVDGINLILQKYIVHSQLRSMLADPGGKISVFSMFIALGEWEKPDGGSGNFFTGVLFSLFNP